MWLMVVGWKVRSVSWKCRWDDRRKSLVANVIGHVGVGGSRSSRIGRSAFGCWPTKSRHGRVTFITHSQSLMRKAKICRLGKKVRKRAITKDRNDNLVVTSTKAKQRRVKTKPEVDTSFHLVW